MCVHTHTLVISVRICAKQNKRACMSAHTIQLNYRSVAGVVAVCPVNAGGGIVGVGGIVREPRVLRLVRVAPRRDRVASDELEIGVLDRGVAVVP
jgi:hypothetical protein